MPSSCSVFLPWLALYPPEDQAGPWRCVEIPIIPHWRWFQEELKTKVNKRMPSFSVPGIQKRLMLCSPQPGNITSHQHFFCKASIHEKTLVLTLLQHQMLSLPSGSTSSVSTVIITSFRFNPFLRMSWRADFPMKSAGFFILMKKSKPASRGFASMFIWREKKS